MPTILIADSGSTKTEWCLVKDGITIKNCYTTGINPYFTSKEDARRVLEEELILDYKLDEVDKLYFYSAGVKAPQNKECLEQLLKEYFPIPQIEVHTDMLGAARALNANNPGIICILGTGSNACYYNGTEIEKNSSSLGYVLGDEGGGVHMGKKVLQHYFYNTFDEDLKDAFTLKYGDNLAEILEKIYKKPFGNRYIASFTHFLKEHRDHYMIHNIIEDSLMEFFQHHILKFRESWQYPVNFIGSIANEFNDFLAEITESNGLTLGNIMKSPMEGLVKYHINN